MGVALILIEHGPGGPALFDGAREVVTARAVAEVLPALQRLDAARAGGMWVAGWIGYEAGLAFEPRLEHLMRGQGPLMAFGVYDGPQVFPELKGSARLAGLEPCVTVAEYGAAFDRVQTYIAAGDCYQVNLTFPLKAQLVQGTALDLYTALRARQPVGFGAYVDLRRPDLDMPVLVSRSPELFVRLDGKGRIETRPMKGTAPRDADPVEDARLAVALRASGKDRAENLMIVDLLRNDISRIARVGSVKVPELFHVESYATVHQMVSRITGQLVEPGSLALVMAALFPCGSITGAPKLRAMQIIAEVEPEPRGAYCGAIGWMGPDGAACFNVAIRTLTVQGDRVRLNVGGGVTHDSTAAGEWEEALWKTRYVRGLLSPV